MASTPHPPPRPTPPPPPPPPPAPAPKSERHEDTHRNPSSKAKAAPKYPIRQEAYQLFYNGHKIAKDGDPPSKWISMGRLGDGTPVHQMPMTPEIEKEIQDGDYYLIEGLEQQLPPSPPVGPPVVVDAPYVEQNADLMTCTMGNWQGEPSGYGYQWQNDGANIGAGAAQYVVTGADVGHTVTCIVTATNAFGSASSTSNGVVVVAPAKR